MAACSAAPPSSFYVGLTHALPRGTFVLSRRRHPLQRSPFPISPVTCHRPLKVRRESAEFASPAGAFVRPVRSCLDRGTSQRPFPARRRVGDGTRRAPLVAFRALRQNMSRLPQSRRPSDGLWPMRSAASPERGRGLRLLDVERRQLSRRVRPLLGSFFRDAAVGTPSRRLAPLQGAVAGRR